MRVRSLGTVGLGVLVVLCGCTTPAPAPARVSAFTPCSGGNWSPAPADVSVDAAAHTDGGHDGPAPNSDRPAPNRDRCEGLQQVADGSSPLIDDFEDGDAVIISAEHRQGTWWVAHDDACISTPNINSEIHGVKPGRGNPSRYALSAHAKDCPTGEGHWGFALSVAFNEVAGFCAYDVAKYQGVQFWARGNVKLLIEVGMRSTEPVAFGGDGTCEANNVKDGCWDRPCLEVTLTNTWKLYHARWDELHQRGYGVAVPFETAKVYGVQFEAVIDDTKGKTAEFYLDNVSFFRTTPDLTPIAPSE